MFSVLLSKVWGYLVAAGGLILVVLGALGMAKRQGKKEAQEEQTEASLKAAKEASEIDAKVHDATDPAVVDGLRKYERD